MRRIPFAISIACADAMLLGALVNCAVCHGHVKIAAAAALVFIPVILGAIYLALTPDGSEVFLAQAAEALAAESAGEHLTPKVVHIAMQSRVEQAAHAPDLSEVLAWSQQQLAAAWCYIKLSNPVIVQLTRQCPEKPLFLVQWPKL